MKLDEPPRVDAPAGTKGARLASQCPICVGSAFRLDHLRFGKKEYLPDAINICCCEACDFIFAADVNADAYQHYYSHVRNDGGHVIDADDADVDVQLQADQIVSRLPPDFAGKILDFGCGLGRLLKVLRRRLPRADLYGHDVANWMPHANGITFVESLQPNETRYDVVIMAHVLEHLVTFEALQTVSAVLASNGLCYIEVPDPGRYASHPRREFMYYFDRLHVNHFSRKALRQLLGAHGLSCQSFGTHAFRYRNGLYPAVYAITAHASAETGEPLTHAADTGTREASSGERDEAPLEVLYQAYRDKEEEGACEVMQAIHSAGGSAGVVVYGAGDNFWRSRGPGGPLHSVRALAVVDRQAVELPSDVGPLFETATEALQRFPGVPIVVTTSQDAADICERLQASWPDRAIFTV